VDDAITAKVNDRPLVVDLDGTLIKSDPLVESFLALLSSSPLRALSALSAVRHGRAELKVVMAEAATADFNALLFNDELIAFIRGEKAKGRRIFLATNTHRRLAEGIAAHTGLFDGVFASDGGPEVKGAAKAEMLSQAFGRGNFDYAGSNKIDMDVCGAAAGILVVGASAGLIRAVSRRFPHTVVMAPRQTRISDYVRTLRVHQWLKNLLVFVPSFTAHHFDAGSLFAALLAFFSFSLCASSAYVLNDLLDMRSDRDHPTKRHRPFAGGRVNIVHGIILFPLILLLSVAIGLFLPWRFLAALAVYYALTLSYSIYLKRRALLDVIALACLYDMRLVGGAAATSVILSPWILTFSVFMFLSLALVKRWAELIERIDSDKGNPAGRGYLLTDLPLLQTMATASGYVAVVVFGLYINSPTVSALYRQPATLWAIPLILLYWLSRILLLTHRGQMHDDPVLFAAKDRISILCGILTVIVVLAGI